MSDSDRIARIEQEMKTWKAIAIAAAAIAVVACLIASRKPPEKPLAEIRLLHRDGKTAALLEPGALRFFDPSGKVVTELTASPELRLTARDSDVRVHAQAGGSAASVIAENGVDKRVALGWNEATGASISARAARTHATVAAAKDGASVDVASGDERAALATSPRSAALSLASKDNTGSISVAPEDGDVKIARAEGSRKLSLRDGSGAKPQAAPPPTTAPVAPPSTTAPVAPPPTTAPVAP